MSKNTDSKTKLNIFFIALKIFICLALMTASTYSLFTAGSDVAVKITSGDIDIKLYEVDSADERIDIEKQSDDLFGKADWEPNQTRIVFLEVENKSNIPIKYMLQLNSLIGDLEGAFEYCAFVSDYFDPGGTTWEALTDGKQILPLKHGVNHVSGESFIKMEPGEKCCYALAIHMLANGSSDYQDGECSLKVHLFAIQGNVDDEDIMVEPVTETQTSTETQTQTTEQETENNT